MSIFIGSIPNTQEDDFRIAEGILNGSIDTRGSLNTLKSKLGNHALLFDRGRDSLYFLFEQMGIEEGDEVITQAFTCVAVVAPILWTGAIPKYVDIERETFNMDLSKFSDAITPKTRAVIVQHTFGNFADTRKIKEIVNEKNTKRDEKRKIYVIEDCAHLYLSNPKGWDIGKYSDAYFFSFSQDKAISCTQGSSLHITNPKLLQKAKYSYENVKKQTHKEASFNARYIKDWNKIKTQYYNPILGSERITKGRILLMLYRFLGRTKSQASTNTLKKQMPRQMSDIQAKLLVNQLEKADILNNHRKDVVNRYNIDLNCEFKFHANTNHLLRYPILVENRVEVSRELKKRNIIPGIWYSSPVFPLDTGEELNLVGYKSGMCPEAEFCSEHILNLPTNIEVEKDDVKEIVDIVNKYAKRIKL